MKKRFFLLMLTSFLIMASLHLGHARIQRGNRYRQKPVRPSLSKLDRARIAEIANELIKKYNVPSYSIGLVYGDDLVYARAFGVVNRKTKKPATPRALYQIGSVTKVFTATLLLALRDDGLVGLDDPVTRYLPTGLPFPHSLDGAPEMTLRHLATHTAGLPKDPVSRVNIDPPGGPGVMRAYSIKELYEGLEATKLVRPMGQYAYSNLGFGLLGHVLERAAKTHYEQLLKRRILAPLGMQDTTVHVPAEKQKRMATAYWPTFEPMIERDLWVFGEISAFGGLTSTVIDLAKFISLQFHTDEKNLKPVSGATIREMYTPQPVAREGNAAIGLGWQIDAFNETGRWIYHGGEVDGFSSFIAFKPDHRIGVIVLANFGGDSARRLAPPLLEIALDWAKKQPTRHAM